MNTKRTLKINQFDFTRNVRARLQAGLAKYGDTLRISGNMASVFAEIEPSFGISVKLSVEADLLRNPKDSGPIKTEVSCSCSHLASEYAILVAAMIEDAGKLGLLIEAAYTNTHVFYAEIKPKQTGDTP